MKGLKLSINQSVSLWEETINVSGCPGVQSFVTLTRGCSADLTVCCSISLDALI